MNGGTLSGGVVVALAATLWLAYLLPTWLRRRDYLNAERNAVRLQQTLRILAETAEAPEEVRVEATAREVARQQKLLKKVRAKADAAARAHAVSEARAAASVATIGPEKPARFASAGSRGDSASKGKDSTRAKAATRPGTAAQTREGRERAFAHAVRRTRLATTGVVIAALVGIAFGAYSMVTAESWWLLAGSTALLICAIAVLRRLGQQVAAHQTARRSHVPVVRQNPELYDHALFIETDAAPEEVEERDVSWAPQPLPKPMYQSPGSRAATAMASLDAAVALRRAAARAELEERAARIAAASVPKLPVPEPVREPRTSTPTASVAEIANEAKASAAAVVPSRYARMGVLDDVQSEHLDLDEALRRRRAAG